MPHLADTNILLRWLEPGTPMCAQAQAAVRKLRLRGETIYITPQNLVEFWNGATRPATANGLGLTPAQADAEARQLESLFPLAEDTPAIHRQWRHLVVACGVSGVHVHDARLAAAMLAHGIDHILTFNVRDFARFGAIVAVHPTSV
ncbi:MAG TPA: type II toxin-antitoxin system VapC family toxin [Armatimonadota bacterium]|nr:type II toxin-antitoxin system VapC family toxin [Armatimonadota bacterium]